MLFAKPNGACCATRCGENLQKLRNRNRGGITSENLQRPAGENGPCQHPQGPEPENSDFVRAANAATSDISGLPPLSFQSCIDPDSEQSIFDL